jgi:putative ABC transport system permease protein
VMALVVSQRAQEFGVRQALGAESRDILRLVLVPGLRLTAAGTAVGLAAALAATRLMSTLIFGVSSSDLATYVAVPVLLGLVGLAACFVPARRATRVSPMEALR